MRCASVEDMAREVPNRQEREPLSPTHSAGMKGSSNLQSPEMEMVPGLAAPVRKGVEESNHIREERVERQIVECRAMSLKMTSSAFEDYQK
jgi:hypothetical protein